MTLKTHPIDIQRVIIDALSSTEDGVGLYDKNDTLVYCNETVAALFGLSIDDALNKTFTELSIISFNSSNGINIESPTLDAWLDNALYKRRSCQFRKFETDTKSGKWYLVTEQLVHDDYLYMYITDITEKKENEKKLTLLSEKLSKLASTDSLTNIDNRRSFYKKSSIEFNRSIRMKLPLSLLVIDLDNFKKINDNYGHAAGDKVLESFAKEVQPLLHEYDVFGRIGGEEFGLMMPNTSSDSAFTIAERIRKHIANSSILFEDIELNISVSIGLAEKSEMSTSVEAIIQGADRNLYQAKINGKNQTATSS
jgi:diguanylate cyclase (GGDEF)-like protein